MPTTERDGVALHYERDGEAAGPAGEGDGETVVFVNDVGAGAWLWSVQAPALAGPHETIVWDIRGTGRSDAPGGQYDVSTLAADLEAVLADCGTTEVHLVGAGLGGMVALAYAHRYARVASLVLVGTAADGDRVTETLADLRASPDDRESLRASLGVALGVAPDAHPDAFDRFVDWRVRDDADPDAWDAQAAAMRTFEAPPLYEITDPALVLHGEADAVVPERAGRDLAADLPRGEFQAVAGGHWCHLTADRAVTDRLDGWLAEVA